MNKSTFIALAILAVSTVAANTVVHDALENDWIPYKDRLHIKILTNLQTYEAAKEFCATQGDEGSKASLVMIKDSDLQLLLENYTHNIVENVWLGGKYDNQSSQFLWEDGTPIQYANWQESFPRNVTDGDACIEMRQFDIKEPTSFKGKWAHATCRKRNLAVCQKTVPWTLEDVVAEMLRGRTQQENEMMEMRRELEKLRATTQDAPIETSVMPVGSTYIEYFNQPSPPALWPYFHWQDITYNYDGLFFRAAGNGAGGWGSIQEECAPRITEMQFYERYNTEWPHQVSVPSNGWSQIVRTGAVRDGSGTIHFEGNRFWTEGCEVRPKNQAIRIWKRVG